MEDMYDNNSDFRDYVDSYCSHRGISKEEALKHITVRCVAQYYKDKTADRIDESREAVNCDRR